MIVDVLNNEGAKVSEVELSDELFGGEVKEHLFYEAVKARMAGRRSGTACTKTRAQVRGGGVKPWRQKGSGRARAGSNRSPIWRHGGTVFGPRPRDYSYALPKKVMRGALKSALRLRLRDGAFKVFDALELDEPKSRKALEMLRGSEIESALIVVEGGNENLKLSVRNLRGYKVIDAPWLNVYDVLYYDTLVMTRAALEKVEAMIK
ncbi:MAG TPA: 50S ribosomal protein L4 [Deltaproteobacteria bacterium]|nr:50S ribosomal protein L4 [Deltaproteobacteria bacterium]